MHCIHPIVIENNILYTRKSPVNMIKTKIPVLFFYFLACHTMSMSVWGDEKIDYTVSADFMSKYIWRGQLLNDDYVFQPCVTAGYKGLTFCIWGNADFTDYTGNKGEFTEYDYTLSYEGKFAPDSKLSYLVGTVHYRYPSSVADTTEVFWGLSYDTFLSPSITVYHDIDEIGGGSYVSFGLSHTVENILKLSDSVRADLVFGASLGWGNSQYNQGYWGVDSAELNDLTLKAALPFDLSNGWSVTPSFNYVTLVNSSIRDTDTFSTGSDYFFTGVNIGKSF